MTNPLIHKTHREIRYVPGCNTRPHGEDCVHLGFIEQAVYNYWIHCALFPISVDSIVDQLSEAPEPLDTQIRKAWAKQCIVQDHPTASKETQLDIYGLVYWRIKALILSKIPDLENAGAEGGQWRTTQQGKNEW